MTDFIDIEQELTDFMSNEIAEEIDRQMIGNMIDVIFPNKDVFISFTRRMGYDSGILPDEKKLSKIELYNLMNLMYNAHLIYHTKEESQD